MTDEVAGAANGWEKALPGEPTFTLLARDPHAPDAVLDWAFRRECAIRRGEKPSSDHALVEEARTLAKSMREWRRENLNTWQTPTQPLLPSLPTPPQQDDLPYPPHTAA
jgi:hypothetical protein